MLRRFNRFVSAVMLTGLLMSSMVIDDRQDEVGAVTPSDATPNATAYGAFPLVFEENKGQTDSRARFIARGSGYSVYLAENEAVFSLRHSSRIDGNEIEGGPKRRATNTNWESDVVRMQFAGGAEQPHIGGVDPTSMKTNYYIGKNEFEQVPNYKKVEYKNIYKDIDAVFYSTPDNQLEYDLNLLPNADPGQIAIRFDGAESVRIAEDGGLEVMTANTTLVNKKPFAYQIIAGDLRQIDAEYEISGSSEVSFKLGAYDTSMPLTIDPVLHYLTYVGGGTSSDTSFEIAADAAGNAYIVGSTSSTDFPIPGSRNADDESGVFVGKINPDGTAFEYLTILEGTDDDFGFGIAVDAGGNAYVAGDASRDFPATDDAFDNVHGTLNNSDAFAAKLDPNGEIVYATFLGGADLDRAFDIAVDAGGKAYVAGETFSNVGFPTKNRYQGCGFLFPESLDSVDAFLTVLNSTGSDITYSTCIGGSVTADVAFSVAVDGASNAYLTGEAKGGNFPTKNAAQPSSGGGTDAFVAKFNPSLSGNDSLIYSTYLGGGGTERALSIAVASNGTAAITGVTGSSNFPLQNAIDTTNQINEAFIAQYNASGTKLNSTFLGGSDQDEGSAIALGNGGTIYVAGSTLSNNFPMATPFQATRAGVRDAFVAKIRFGINNNPGVSSSSYLGGAGNEFSNGIAVRGGFIYLSGDTQSTNLATTAPDDLTPLKPTSNANSTSDDGFVARILDSRKETIGTFDPVNTVFGLRNTLNAGAADIVVDRGVVGDVPVAGDLNGDGIDTVSTFNNGFWRIANFNVLAGGGYGVGLTANFGLPGDLPVTGDWDGDGIESLGTYRPSTGEFFLSNAVQNPQVNFQIRFGVAEDLPVAGDWDGDGIDTVGVFRPSLGLFFLTNANVANPKINFTAFFGTNGDLPVAGDWNGDGLDSVGVWRPSTLEFFLSNDNINIANQFIFGAAGDRPVVGDWDGKPNQ
jgi:hypothetical protein